MINRTPDVYRAGQPWSHVFSWNPGQYEETLVQGPVFIETFRRGVMPFTSEELSASVRYSMPVPLPVGTEVYEEMVWAPFSLGPGEGNDILKEVGINHRRIANPLVVVP